MKKYIFVVLAITITLTSCDRRSRLKVESEVSNRYMMAPPPAISHAKIARVSQAEILERKLIKNGEITFSTKDINQTRLALEKACKEFNGYISSEEQQKFDQSINYEEVIRIPSGRFDAFMKVIENLGEHIEYRNLVTQDVTEEFIDTEARLKTKKELES